MGDTSKNDVSFVLLRHKNRYIFQHRDDKPSIVCPGLFAGFGGKIEPDESQLEAAVRELMEETSLTVEPSDLSYLGALDMEEILGLRYVYAADIDDDRFEVYEGQGKVFFTVEELRTAKLSLFTPSTGEAIKRWLLKE